MIKTIREPSNTSRNAHISLVKYKNLNNISHYHSDYELIYVNEGTALVAINETIFNLHKGMCAFVHSNDIHYIQSDTNTIITALKADSKYFDNIFASKRLVSPVLNEALPTESMLNEIAAEFKSHAEHSDVVIDCTATKFFIHMLRWEATLNQVSTSPHKLSTRDLYSEISKKIIDEYTTITFEEAARHMHLSKPYFSKVFHNIFGMTFTHYLNAVKIVSAIEKLREGRMSMTEIAASCGFNTIRSFNRVFREFTGYSPSSLPADYTFLYSLHDSWGLDPTLNCTEVLK